MRQCHGFGCCRCFIKHGRIGNIHTRQIHNHLLEVQQRFQTTLRNLRLIRRVRGVPRWIFEDIAQNYSRRVRTVIALTNQAGIHGILLRVFTQLSQSRLFRQVLGKFAHTEISTANIVWNHCINKGVEIVVAQSFEHALLFSRIGADMTGSERSRSHGL